MKRQIAMIACTCCLVSSIASVCLASGNLTDVYGYDRSETFVMGVSADFRTLEPMEVNQPLDASVLHSCIGDVLAIREADGTIVPRLAESWEQKDELTWEFYLREGVTAHNGEAFTASDVKYSVDRAIEGYEGYMQLPAETDLKEVIVIDDYTVQLVTNTPSYTMEYWLYEMPIVPEEYYSSHSEEEVASAPIGFGPYQFVDYTQNDHMTLAWYPDWYGWNGSEPDAKNVIIRAIPEQSTRINELLAGNVDFIDSVSVDLAEQCNSDSTSLDAQEGLRKCQLTISIEKGNEALQDVRVRQALNYAIDKENIVENILSGYTSVYNSYVNPPNNNPDLKAYEYNPEKAMELLAEAGYADGLTLTLSSPTERYGLDKEITMQMAADLEAVGIKVELNYMELGVFLEQLDAHELTDLIWIGWAALVNPIVENLILTTGHVDNSATWSNEAFDTLYAEMSTTADADKRQELNYEMQAIVWEECPWIFGWKLPFISGVNNRIEWNIRNDGRYNLWEVAFAE